MNTRLTIDLPAEVKMTLNEAANEEGVTEERFAAMAVRDYLFIRRFRRLRERLMDESGKRYTDDEIFNLVS